MATTTPLPAENVTYGMEIIFAITSVMIAIILFFFGGVYLSLFGIVLMWGGYFGWGFTLIGQNEAAVSERLGKFRKVLLPGWHILLFPGVVDRLTESLNRRNTRIPILQNFNVPIFRTEEGAMNGELVDFKDDSATVTADIWVRIGYPDWKSPEDNKPGIIEAVKRYVYAATDAKARAHAMANEALRPVLQSMKVDDALKKKGDIAFTDSDEAVMDTDLQEMGLWLVAGEKKLTINDIALSPNTIQLRQKILEAEKEAVARKTNALGIRLAAEIIAKGEKGKATGQDAVSIEEALLVQQRLAAFKVMDGAKLTMVYPTIGAATSALLDMSSKPEGSPKDQRPARSDKK